MSASRPETASMQKIAKLSGVVPAVLCCSSYGLVGSQQQRVAYTPNGRHDSSTIKEEFFVPEHTIPEGEKAQIKPQGPVRELEGQSGGTSPKRIPSRISVRKCFKPVVSTLSHGERDAPATEKSVVQPFRLNNKSLGPEVSEAAAVSEGTTFADNTAGTTFADNTAGTTFADNIADTLPTIVFKPFVPSYFGESAAPGAVSIKTTSNTTKADGAMRAAAKFQASKIPVKTPAQTTAKPAVKPVVKPVVKPTSAAVATRTMANGTTRAAAKFQKTKTFETKLPAKTMKRPAKQDETAKEAASGTQTVLSNSCLNCLNVVRELQEKTTLGATESNHRLKGAYITAVRFVNTCLKKRGLEELSAFPPQAVFEETVKLLWQRR